jgi:pimeloyl-ACP methyl ester carboxylesterase
VKRRWVRITLWAALAAVVVALGAFVIWGMTPLGPGEVALQVIEGSDTLEVTETSAGWEFRPRSAEPTAALVLYPGGHVDARSYAPLAALIAEKGYLVVVPPMPLSLAVLSPNAADEAIEAHPGVESWSVGGHSLGGAMAAQYAAKNAGRLDALVLLAAYASGGSDLSGTDIGVLDTYGDLDGVLTMENHEAGAALLPAETWVHVINGGNHAQFGDYGPQGGDNDATISPEQQWIETAEHIDALLKEATAR